MSATGWQIKRRGITFKLNIYTCVFDDGHDGVRLTGSSNANGPYCSNSAAAASPATDSNPDDFRQVEVDVTWSLNGKAPTCKGARSSDVTVGLGTGCVTQTELVANPSGGLGPTINVIDQTFPPAGTVESGNSASFSVTTNTGADAINWTADDGKSGAGSTAPGNTDGTGWVFTWPFATGILDGPHTVTVQAFLFGAPGVPKTKPVSINLKPPATPQLSNPPGGVDTRIAGDTAVALSWQQNTDQDIIGYTVYRAPGNTDAPWKPDLTSATPDQPVCSTASVDDTICFDEQNPGAAASHAACPAGMTPAPAPADVCVNYYVVAFDEKWATGNPVDCQWVNGGQPAVTVSLPSTPNSVAPLTTTHPTLWTSARPGCPSAVISVNYTAGAARAQPDPPTAAVPACSTSNGLAVIHWTPPANSTGIVGYRIYRDPQSAGQPEYASLANVIGVSPNPSYTDPNPTGGNAHTYYVTSVDSLFQESVPELRVDWTPVTCP
jgi:hypothetical protein